MPRYASIAPLFSLPQLLCSFVRGRCSRHSFAQSISHAHSRIKRLPAILRKMEGGREGHYEY